MNRNINILRLLVLVLLTIVMGAPNAWAQTTPSKWDESVSSSLSTQDGTNTNPGTSSNPYLIQSAADLAYFGSQMNGKNWYVVLTTDIDLDNHEWTYGKNSATNFKGHFDGNGKTISNLTIVPTSAKNNGFFSSLQGTSTARAEVKNLIIDGVTISQTTDLASTTITGALAGNVTEYTDIDNVTVKNVSVEFKNLTNTNFVGGLIGRVEKNNSKITTCSVEKPSIDITGEIKGGASYIGGAIGEFAGSANLLSTIDGLTVTSPSVTLNKISIKDCFIGAVFGRINTYTTINNVTANNPALTYNNTDNPNVALNLGTFAGYIVGATNVETPVTNVTIGGTAQLTLGTEAKQGTTEIKAINAGLVGTATTNVRLEGWTIGNSNIQVWGNLTTTASRLGGLVGYAASANLAQTRLKDIKITGATNVNVPGNIGIASYVGGVIGDCVGVLTNGIVDATVFDGMNITSPSVNVNNCSVANCYIGSVFGCIRNYNEVNGITVSNPTLNYNNANNSNVSLFLGTFAGYAAGIAAIKETPITKVSINGTAQLTIGTDANKATTEAMNIKAGLIGQATTNVRLEEWTIENSAVQVYGKLTTTGSQLGAFAGNLTGAANAPAIAKTVKITGSSSLNVSGDITVASYLGGFIGQATTNVRLEDCEVKEPIVTLEGGLKTAKSYVGGAFGYFLGAAGNTSYIDGLTVTDPKVNIVSVADMEQYVGSVFGRINTYANINDVTAANPKLAYSAVGSPNIALYLGTFAGYLTGAKEQENPITNVKVTGTANLTIGTDADKATTNISNVRAGLLGIVTTNVRLENWSVANTGVQVYGSLTTSTDYFGGLAGYMESGSNAASSSAHLTLKNVKITGNSTVNVTGNIGVGSYLGGFAGAIGQGNVTYSQVNIDGVGVDGVATVSVGGNVTAAGYVGGFTGYLYGKANTANQVTADNVSVGTTNLTITGQTTAGSYYGGLAGRVNTMCDLNGWNVKTASNLTFNGNITALSYVGGAIGSLEGATGYPSSATGFDIKGLDINFDCNILTNGIGVGGIAGQLNAIDKTNKIEKSSVSGKVHTTGSHTYTNGNLPYTFGGIVGYLPQTSSTFSEVNNCVSEVDFDLSGLTPATDGNMYSGLVVGGVVGRINTPSRLPESLYYSGKIYAPTAGVGPIVGVFVTKLNDNKYIYDDYTGVNATAISADEWAKADDWYYNDYKIGLSSDVASQTLNTTESPVEGYLTIGKETLTNANPNSTATKISKTILYYAATSDITPAWTTNKNTYPAYYMYYMQGVNRGNYLEDDKVEETKKDILSGKLAILILTDANADFTKEANRGVIPHTLKATASGVDSYKWYVDGNPQSETSENFTITPAFKGNTIAVEAIKGDKAIKRVECKVISVLRVTDASAATLGTKTNPYLIGAADELQLLSYLSTLPLNTPWEKTYTSDNHYNKAYYELDGDIDLSGVEDFTPISFATGFVANNTMSLGYVFDGVFDGKLHTISGLKEGWYGGVINANDSYAGWGLFSIVGSPMPTVKVGDSETSPAVIRNLIIDGATLTHKTNNTTFNYNETTGVGASNNVCIGVLAGIVQNNTKIDNIEIRNSKVTDEGSSDYSLASRGLHVGGAVGTIQNAFNEIGNAPLNTKLQHIAAKVDITLEHPQFADATIPGQLGIFNVGGIIGRYCATSALQEQAQISMPAYTLYSGSVNAPKAWISPVLGAIRYVAQQSLSFANYSRIWEGNNNADGTQLTILNAQYYNYRINGKLLTEFYPSFTCARGARSIMLHSDGLDDLATYDAKKYQGVNYTAISLDNGGNPTMKFMNEAQTDGMYWVCKDGFAHLTNQNPIDAYLAPQGVNKFNAELTGGSGNSYRWIVSFDGETWSDFEGVSGQSITAPASTIDKLIVAVITYNGVEYRSQPELVVSFDKCLPYMKQAGDESAGFDFSIVWFGAEPEASNVTYQWYHADKVTPFPDATYKSIHLTKSEFDEAGGTVWCQIKVLEYGFETSSYLLHSHPMDAIVVFVDGTNGVDNAENSRERGWTPETAVKTIDHANSLLDGGPWDKNIIVVVGTLNSDADFRSTGSNPATLTGKWDGTDYKGVIKIKQINPEGGVENDLNPVHQFGKKGSNCHVLADTKFEYLTFEADSKTAGNNFIECHGNDVWFGKGLVMTGFQNLTKNHGNLGVAQIIPELTIILTATNLNEETIRMYTNRVKPQEVTFESGHYGRIMGGRYTNGFFAKPENTSHTILGSAEHPVWAIVNVNIDKENPNKGIVYRNENPNKGTSEIDNFTCDINCIIAGLTDGTMYGDYQINVHGGKINYIVGGNQGNPVPNGSKTFTQPDGKSGDWGQWPNATYFGRTIINVEQDENLKDIDIENLYAGGLGRERNGSDASTTVVDMYLYGRTEVNMKSGTVSGNVYGGGAGGVLGLNPWDAHVPYATTEEDNAANGIMNKVQYGMLDSTTSPTYAKVTLHNLKDDGTYEVESLDLEKSSTTLNITGGTINGSVYGGGYGFVSNMPTEVTMQGVGSIFGTTNVNISGGTILGSVYGGSQGASGYYGLKNNYGQTIDHIAEMNGTVNLKIYGTETQFPSIAGDIYGGGQGVATQNTEEYLRIATAGNIDLGDKYKTDVNILIDLPESHPFEGNIYGGGEMGAVDGKTNVVIKSGYFDGNVYGGGKGEEGHANKAKVTGSTNVEIGTKTINVPITSEELDPEAEGEVTITGSVFGGGQKAIVTGNTRVKVGDQD